MTDFPSSTAHQTTPRTAIVTGASRGIGRAVALDLAALGHRVVSLDREEGTDERVTSLACDVADADAVAAAVAEVERRFGPVGILVNNAGISPASPDGRAVMVEDIAVEDWRRVLSINLDGVFHCCRAVLPGMKRAGWGRIVNFSSQGGRTRSMLSGAHYAASKAALFGFTRVLAGQAGGHGITANCIAPGRIETDQSEQFALDDYVAQIPAGRLGRPGDIAAATRYLVSEDAAFVIGAILDVNGGFFMP
ncbi:SDR family NAD(P)-dependent oxidoreductase [Croceicoccus sp. BE223]|uniref:SDR family NAD(P)-dependent oxidoreductase n=1 Tax=Croceicoccus sp. BE223 TaxID=2817716 RepID=UPI00285542AB|nr:SDR family NAD(P)-dependent oxidoreductase [Croceicoccus sp. BE223]MDR7101370.1 3-oxoacyl-[acyl-carrier protein] reductase [Croceicoccus sp. BE223]